MTVSLPPHTLSSFAALSGSGPNNYGRSRDAKPPYYPGHGWGAANCVAWNCTIAKLLLVESPPGAHNWAIGCKAGAFTSSGPERGAKRGASKFESNIQPVGIHNLYEAQLAERMRAGSRVSTQSAR